MRLAASIYDPKKQEFIKPEDPENAWLDMMQSCIDMGKLEKCFKNLGEYEGCDLALESRSGAKESDSQEE